jgi:hypothetical protein
MLCASAELWVREIESHQGVVFTKKTFSLRWRAVAAFGTEAFWVITLPMAPRGEICPLGKC